MPAVGSRTADNYFNNEKWRIIHPNASLALFFKDSSGKVELIFYTRFLEIYYFYNAEIREYCKDVATNKQKIFDSLSKKYNMFSPVTKIPNKRYYFVIHTHKGGNCPGELFPWIRLWDSNKKEPGFFGKGNTIHGTINTKGCWMLLRNFILKENKYNGFMKCYLLYNANARQVDIRSCFRNLNLGIRSFHEIRNYSYFAFINKFTGINYNFSDSNIKIPRMIRGINNYWTESPIPLWSRNVVGQEKFGYDKPWAEVFIFKRGDHFTPDPGDADQFK